MESNRWVGLGNGHLPDSSFFFRAATMRSHHVITSPTAIPTPRSRLFSSADPSGARRSGRACMVAPPLFTSIKSISDSWMASATGKRPSRLPGDGLPPLPQTQDETNEGDDILPECAICQEATAGTGGVLTGCKHEFHRECLEKWANVCIRALRPVICPTCRQPLHADTFEKRDPASLNAVPMPSTMEINTQRDNRMYYSDWDAELAFLGYYTRGPTIFGMDLSGVMVLGHPSRGGAHFTTSSPSHQQVYSPRRPPRPRSAPYQPTDENNTFWPPGLTSSHQSEQPDQTRDNPLISALWNCTSFLHSSTHQRQRPRGIPMLGMHEHQQRRFGMVAGNLPPELRGSWGH